MSVIIFVQSTVFQTKPPLRYLPFRSVFLAAPLECIFPWRMETSVVCWQSRNMAMISCSTLFSGLSGVPFRTWWDNETVMRARTGTGAEQCGGHRGASCYGLTTPSAFPGRLVDSSGTTASYTAIAKTKTNSRC